MKRMVKYTINTLPFVFGIIFVLTSLLFLVETSNGSFVENYFKFMVFIVAGVPLVIYGINKNRIRSLSHLCVFL